MSTDAPVPPGEPSPGRLARPDRIALAAGIGAVLWIPLALWPNADLPAWPSASLGIAAMVLASFPGRPLPRGLAAFTGLVGLVVGAVQIAAKWALLEVVP